MFHGTSTEVTVPESSTALRQHLGRQPAPLELLAEHPAGRTSATYWSPAITFKPIPLALTARIRLPSRPRPRHDRGQQPLEEPGALHDRGERQRGEHEPDRGEQARHTATREELVDGGDSGDAHVAGGHRRVDRLDACCHRPEARVADEGLDGSHWVKQARIPAKSADPMIARNGGAFRMEKKTRRSNGRRVTAEMLNASPGPRPRPPCSPHPGVGGRDPSTRKMTRLTPRAGPAVQNMLRTCSATVRPPPTSFGTRIVVSDNGVILSPK